MEIEKTLERLYSVTGIPLSLLDGGGTILCSWPRVDEETVTPFARLAAIEDHRLQKRDAQHPLISFIDPGFLLGVVELNEDRYVLIGLVSPTAQRRADISDPN